MPRDVHSKKTLLSYHVVDTEEYPGSSEETRFYNSLTGEGENSKNYEMTILPEPEICAPNFVDLFMKDQNVKESITPKAFDGAKLPEPSEFLRKNHMTKEIALESTKKFLEKIGNNWSRLDEPQKGSTTNADTQNKDSAITFTNFLGSNHSNLTSNPEFLNAEIPKAITTLNLLNPQSTNLS